MSWPLADSGDEKIDVVDIGIQQLESVDDLLGDQVLHLVEGVDFAQSAVSTEGSISCETKKRNVSQLCWFSIHAKLLK